MKKILLSLFLTIIMFNPSHASNIEILPTMQSRAVAQDRVWVGTFQLVWNDFMDKIAFCEIKFPEGTPEIVNELNKKEFTTNDISESCYYKYAGKITKNTKKTIIKAIKRKFNETSDILDKFDLAPSNDRYFIYAMLKKDFKFVKAFDKLGKSTFNGKQAEFFGINSNSSKQLDDEVEVLFYNNSKDFAVMLNTVGKDQVYLYRTESNKPFNCIYADMIKKQDGFKGNKNFASVDELKVPDLSFSKERSYDEICNKRVKGTNLVIEKAIETIKFDMNNEGVKLKSEAGMSVALMALPKIDNPRYFYFNNTFYLFLKERGKNKPYCALRVNDISNWGN